MPTIEGVRGRETAVDVGNNEACRNSVCKSACKSGVEGYDLGNCEACSKPAWEMGVCSFGVNGIGTRSSGSSCESCDVWKDQLDIVRSYCQPGFSLSQEDCDPVRRRGSTRLKGSGSSVTLYVHDGR